MPASIFAFIAMGRQLWVPLHHLLTVFLRVRIRNLRIEFRKPGSRITTKEPKNKFPTWLLVGFVQMAIDIVLATLVLGFTAPVPYRSWYYGEPPGAKIVVSFHCLSAADLGRGSRLKFEGRITFDKKDDDEDEVNPPSLPVYRDATAAGAGEVGAQSRKAGADSPAMI
ncbi:uncharacterized protein RSE6_09082 [Rhynchosporium secalis]|uniref:Uncharacterized protein n=1 Tax=Rhynchosporium secalis TaxID=38038 RepID=A0A1E1MH70_RHYSE|nr:uncharacterized protein RSE6_09082 [Rhynchosporium secalis]